MAMVDYFQESLSSCEGFLSSIPLFCFLLLFSFMVDLREALNSTRSQWFVNVCSSQDLPFQMDLSQEMISEMECNVASIQSNIELFPSSPTAYKIHWSIWTNPFGSVQVMRKYRPKLHLHYISILRFQTVLQVNWKINL